MILNELKWEGLTRNRSRVSTHIVCITRILAKCEVLVQHHFMSLRCSQPNGLSASVQGVLYALWTGKLNCHSCRNTVVRDRYMASLADISADTRHAYEYHRAYGRRHPQYVRRVVHTAFGPLPRASIHRRYLPREDKASRGIYNEGELTRPEGQKCVFSSDLLLRDALSSLMLHIRKNFHRARVTWRRGWCFENPFMQMTQ